MTAPVDLLDLAEAALAGVSPQQQRVACWLARAAFETVVDAILETRDAAIPGATMRSRLTVLGGTDGSTDVASRAEYAWLRLSDACHQHAYELSPTAGEARHLLDLVRSLLDDADDR